MHYTNKGSLRRQHGLTLIELITTVTVIAILAAIAVPTYDRYSRNSYRAAAKSMLEQVRGRVEGYYLNNKSYTSNATQLGFQWNPLEIQKSGEPIAPGSGDAKYQIVINVPGVFCPTCTYEVGAIPVNTQTKDTDCMTLFVNSQNQRGASGPKGIDCW